MLATNTTTFNLSLYKTKTDDATLNNCILNIVNLLEANNSSYPDNFPINNEKKYTIKDETLKSWLGDYKLPENASEDEAINYFVKKYKIKNENWEEIRKILAIRYEITTKGYSSTKSLEIAKDVSREVIAQISEKNTDYPGITITTDSERKYNYNNLASHILGYIGRINKSEYDESKETDNPYKNDDYVGRTGIEAMFEKYLRGKDGKEEIEMSVDGAVTGSTVTEDAIQGSSIVLTIDAKIQKVTEDSLKNNIEKIRAGGFGKAYNAEGGSVVVIDVKNGEILAMASYPDFDPNVWVGGISQSDYQQIKENNSWFNKSIQGTYEPGSVFKMATAIAGLESGTITASTTINDTGIYTKYREQKYTPHCWIYDSYRVGHGLLNVEGAIQKSCNYFFFETADKMGIKTLVKYAKYFGLGQKTGVELPSENAGLLASPDTMKEWSAGKTLQTAIGQQSVFTPLQIAKYTAMVANRGKIINPTLIKTVLNADGTEESKRQIRKYVNEKLKIENNETEDLNISDDNIQVVLQGMKSVAEDGGTAYNIFKNFEIEIGGKTGSAEAAGGKVNAWFAGFAPYENPEICVVVMVENGGHGNYTAEVVRDIISEYFGMNINSTEINESNNAQSYTESIN